MHDIIYARTQPEGLVVDAKTAPRDAAFVCLQCGERLILKRGEVRAPHFAHQVGEGCGGEKLAHLLAKQLIVALLRSRRPVTLRRVCASAGCEAVHDAPYVLPEYDDVQEEVLHGPFRLDVGVLRAGETVAGIEVFYTSRLSRFKRQGLDVPWLEVDAAQILAARGQLWCPVLLETPDFKAAEQFRSRLQRYRASQSLSQLRGNPKVLDTAQRYLAARFGARREALSPSVPWVCPECAEEVTELGDLTLPEDLPRPELRVQGGAGEQQPGPARLETPFFHAWLRDMVPDLYQDAREDAREDPQMAIKLPVSAFPVAPPLFVPLSHRPPSEAELRERTVLSDRERAGQIAEQGKLRAGFDHEVLDARDLALFSERRAAYLAALQALAQHIQDFKGVEQNAFVPRGPCPHCTALGVLVWSHDEVFVPEALGAFLSPQPPRAAALARSLPRRGVWRNVCPECFAPLELPNVGWRVLLPGRVLLRMLQARGTPGLAYHWGTEV